MRRTTLMIFLAVLCSVPARAAAEPLSLRRCLELARMNNLDLGRQDERIALVAAEAAVLRSASWPTLRLRSSASYISELPQLAIPAPSPAFQQGMEIGVRDRYDISVDLSVPIFTGLRTYYLVRSAEQRRRLSMHERTGLEHTILLQVRRLYHALEANILSREVLAGSARRIRNHLEQARMLFGQAQATPFDTLEIANRLLRTETELLELHHRYRITAGELADIVGIAAVDTIEVSVGDDDPLSIRPLDECMAEAERHRPELDAHDARIREQELLKKAATAAYFPQVFAGASLHYARPGADFFGDEWMDYYTVGVELQWELWNPGRRGNEIRRIDHAAGMARIDREKARLEIHRQVRAAHEELSSIREQIELQRRLLAQERERYRIVRDRYGQGMATSFDLRDVEESLTAEELELRRSYVAFSMNRALMEFATGLIGAGE